MTTAAVMATAAPASASMVWGLALLNHHVLWLGLGLRLTSAANGRQLRLGADRVWDHLLLDQDGCEYMRFLRFLRQPIKLAQQLRQLGDVGRDAPCLVAREQARQAGPAGSAACVAQEADEEDASTDRRMTTPPRRFPPPWTMEERNDACFIVRDTNGQGLGYFYLEEEPGRRSAANLPTRDGAKEVRRSVPLRTAN